jgi:glucose-1-phosphate adenylyltransferase
MTFVVERAGTAVARPIASSSPEAWDRLLQSTCTVVLAGGRGTRLQQMTDLRAKPAVPFGGALKIIDFTLSNCINSGLRQVKVLTQYKAQSLIRHVARAWSLLDAGRGEAVEVVPAQQQRGASWYRGTADAVHQNAEMLREGNPTYVLVLAGDHVYKMDYARLIAQHARCDADVTVACIEVPLAQACAFGVVGVDADGRVREFSEKPARPVPLSGKPGMVLVSMGIYVFRADFLWRELARDADDAASCHDFGGDILPAVVSRARVFAHDFAESCVGASTARPYWRDVGPLGAYWAAHMDLLAPTPDLDLYDPAWPIRGQPAQLPGAKFAVDANGRGGTAVDSIVCGGCLVSGASVRRSLLFPRVRVGEASVVDDSVLLPGVVVGRHVVLRRVIVDESCVLPDGIKIGVYPDEDRARFTVTADGVTLVTPGMLTPEAAPVCR